MAMSNNIIDFPPVDRPITETEIDKLHSQAFRDLEGGISDCVSMAKIAADQIHDLKTEDRELVFAVAHTWELLAKLKADYYAAWYDEKRGAS
jgi:hypothetical protein